MNKTTILVCYKAGTQEMFKIWFNALNRHTKEPICVIASVVSDEGDVAYREACEVFGDNESTMVVQLPKEEINKYRIHGNMIDGVLKRGYIESEFLLTMDSDCFPVADGWLDDFYKMMDNGAKVVGILQPFAPPVGLDEKKLAWRVLSQGCWSSTHVACQMIRMSDLKELDVLFSVGDDTGLLINFEAKKRNWKFDGFKITRCAKPVTADDPEFNRYVSIIFGDKIYHHGGFTRTSVCGDKPFMSDAYGWVKDRIMKENGAEFLLDDCNSYTYKFDREEEVSNDRIDRLFGKKTMK
jgi:hypothetical protein